MSTPADNTDQQPGDDRNARWAALGEEIDRHDVEFIENHPEAARQYSRGK